MSWMWAGCLAASCSLPSSYQHLPLTILQPAFVLPASASNHLAACLRPNSICLSTSCRLPPSYRRLPLTILQPASVLPASASRHLAACLHLTSICISPSCLLPPASVQPQSVCHLPPPILPPSCHNLPLPNCRIDLTRAAHQRFSFCHNFLWPTSLLLKTSRAESSRW